MQEKKDKKINEFILEVRYKPNARILDRRGDWAERISEHMNLPRWRIVENRVDVFDDTGRNRAFVGYRNSGFNSHDVPTANYFPDQSLKLFRFLLKLDGFGSPFQVERIGVRLKAYQSFAGEFSDLVSRFGERYISLTEAARKILSGKLIDIGAPLNFADSAGNCNTNGGPMEQEQAAHFMNREPGDVPERGLYVDIDYWIMPNEQMSGDRVLERIQVFSKSAWEKQEAITRLVLG